MIVFCTKTHIPCQAREIITQPVIANSLYSFRCSIYVFCFFTKKADLAFAGPTCRGRGPACPLGVLVAVGDSLPARGPPPARCPAPALEPHLSLAPERLSCLCSASQAPCAWGGGCSRQQLHRGPRRAPAQRRCLAGSRRSCCAARWAPPSPKRPPPGVPDRLADMPQKQTFPSRVLHRGAPPASSVGHSWAPCP